jgi:hypothetical protein
LNGIHSGFDKHVDRIWNQIEKIVLPLKNQSPDILITGHSLGGAAAVIVAHRLEQNSFCDDEMNHSGPKLQTVTFGAPRVGTKKFSINTRLFRYRLAGDFVPYLPPEFINDYFHIGYEFLIESDSHIIYKSDESMLYKIMRLNEWIKVLREQDVASFINEHMAERYIHASISKTIRLDWESFKAGMLKEYERYKERHG